MEYLKIAQLAQLDEICTLYSACKESLLNNNIHQWGDWDYGYPYRDYLRNCIEKKELFLFIIQEQIIGAVVLNESQSPEWNTIHWSKTNKKALVIHAMVIHPEYQNRGYGKQLLSLCEEYAIDHGYNAIRLDSFPKNTVSNKLYQNHGYANLGTVIFDMKPENNKEYFCYEKLF